MSYPPPTAPYDYKPPGASGPYPPAYAPGAGPDGQPQIGFQPGYVGGPNQQQQVYIYKMITSNIALMLFVHFLEGSLSGLPTGSTAHCAWRLRSAGLQSESTAGGVRRWHARSRRICAANYESTARHWSGQWRWRR